MAVKTKNIKKICSHYEPDSEHLNIINIRWLEYFVTGEYTFKSIGNFM